MAQAQQHSFRTRARLINQLGEQLIKNEAIALLELIKNSYDADASKCTVTLTDPESLSDGKISIRDDGEGMGFDVLSTVWLEIGTSYKEDQLKVANEKRSHKFDRLRLGEKGIGRLGVHRLGKDIEIVSRTADASKESVLRINWDDISRTKYIEELPIELLKRKPETFLTGHGTEIVIKRLRTPWTRKLARDCARSIMSLNSPFKSDDSFQVSFSVPGSEWLDGLLTFDDVKEYKLYSFDVTMSGNEITKFSYKFVRRAPKGVLFSRFIGALGPVC